MNCRNRLNTESGQATVEALLVTGVCLIIALACIALIRFGRIDGFLRLTSEHLSHAFSEGMADVLKDVSLY